MAYLAYFSVLAALDVADVSRALGPEFKRPYKVLGFLVIQPLFVVLMVLLYSTFQPSPRESRPGFTAS